MIAVRSTPASIPKSGLENLVRTPVNSGTLARGFTALLIVSMPIIRMAKPSKIIAALWILSFLETINIPTPMMAITGAKEVGFKSCTKKLELLMPAVERIQDVTVVPMLAPIMIPTACSSFIMPEFTKPTTITVVAEEDWSPPLHPVPLKLP